MVEGLFAMAYPAMEERIDLLGFIDAPAEVRLQRRIERDGSERGYTEEEVCYQWHNHVRPGHCPHRTVEEQSGCGCGRPEHWQAGLETLIAKMEEA